MNIFGIIPARYDSSRFPGKPLAQIQGKPMIQRVYEQAVKCTLLTGLVIATDDERIRECAEAFGGNVCMTSSKHRSGTERCNEAVNFFGDISGDDIILNIQGDEPFIHPEQIGQLAKLMSGKDVLIGTLMKKIGSEDELFDDNVVKVIPGRNFQALYFGRQAMPFVRGEDPSNWIRKAIFYKHVGMYGYRSSILAKLVKLSESPLEKAESLEQLRWLENGYAIHLAKTEFESFAIDSPSDLSKITNIT
jgi:3-deoxy-manno-octulosonate cytidylyltransferase (CMP-KDO synthetase)